MAIDPNPDNSAIEQKQKQRRQQAEQKRTATPKPASTREVKRAQAAETRAKASSRRSRTREKAAQTRAQQSQRRATQSKRQVRQERNKVNRLLNKQSPLARAFGCAIPVAEAPAIGKLNYSASELSQVQKAYGLFIKNLESMKSQARTQSARMLAQNRQLMYDNLVRVGEFSQRAHLDISAGTRIEAWLAARVGVTKEMLGMGDSYTAAGFVRESLLQARRDGTGYLSKLLREHRVAEVIKDHSQRFDDIMKQAGIRDRAQRAYISQTSVELGALPYLENFGGIGEMGKKYLLSQMETFKRELNEVYGLSPAQVDELLGMGSEINQVYNQVGTIAHEAGINFSHVEAIGYAPRVLSDEAKKRINWRYKELNEGTIEWSDGSSGDVANILTKARNTSDSIIEQEVILDYVIRTVSQRKYGSASAIYDKIGGTGAAIADFIEDGNKMSRVLFEELGEDTTDRLVTNGILSRIPLTSNQVFDLMREKYQMPFKGLDEAFATDWNTGYNMYVKQLETLAGESGYFNNIVKQAISGEWGVSANEFFADPEKFKGFVPLLAKNDAPGAIKPGQIKKFYLDPRTRKNTVSGMLERTYVHPSVAQLIQATLATQTDAIAMNAFASTMHALNTTWRGFALFTAEYLPRQLGASLFYVTAGGGNVLMLPEMTTRVMSYTAAVLNPFGKKMTPDDAARRFFDDKRAIYTDEKLTMYGVWNRLKEMGYINDLDPMTGGSTTGTTYSTRDIKQVSRNLRYARSVYETGGAARLIQEMGGVANSGVQSLMHPIMVGNNMMDIIGRFAGALSTSRKYTDDIPWHNPVQLAKDALYKGGDLISGRYLYHGKLEDGVEHWKNYFFQYDDSTAADRFMGRYVTPFWSFASKNIPAAMRHAVRHPSRYATFAKLYALSQSDAIQSGDLTEGSMPAWMLNVQPIYMKIKGGRSDGRDAWVAMPTSSIDPYQQVFADNAQAANAVLGMFGIWDEHTRPLTTGETLEDAPWSSKRSNELFDAMVQRVGLYPSQRALISQVSGVDVTNEFKQELEGSATENSFLGIRMSRSTEMWMRALMPLTTTVNRMNPGGVFGEKEYQSPYTGNISRPARPSPLTGVPRTDTDSTQNSNEFPILANNVYMQFAGLRMYPIDEATQAGFTWGGINASISEGKKYIRASQRQLDELEPGTEFYNTKQDEIARMTGFWYQVLRDRENMRAWAEARGIKLDEASKELAQQGIKVGDLPNAQTPDEQKAMLTQFLGQ